jgi:hypothetical protein
MERPREVPVAVDGAARNDLRTCFSGGLYGVIMSPSPSGVPIT